MITPVNMDGPLRKPESYKGICVKLRGIHADFSSLPTDCGNGSSFYEMDTGKYYMFDEFNSEWIEQ